MGLEEAMADDGERIVRQMLADFNARQWADFVSWYTEDAVISYPQSGERIVGRATILRMVEAFPSPPTFTVTDVHAGAGLVVARADIDYGEGPLWKGAFVYLMEESRVQTEIAYFGAPFQPAEWRKPFTSG